MPTPFARRRLPAVVVLAASAALALGATAAVHYHRLGLTLTHYDARGHLVVARRIVDSITPGWQQIGAVWLPLPHLLNALPVQIDLFYRTGASGVAISVVSFAIATGAIVWMVLALTESAFAAVAAALVFALNPNVLYLQSTPMTEPLLIALVTVAIALLVEWTQGGAGSTRTTGCAFALACLTRYEAWPVTAAALALAAGARWRRGDHFIDAVRGVAAIARYPAVAIVAFAIFSRVVIGEWIVTSGFFVPENKAIGDAALVAREIGWGLATLGSEPLAWLAAAGLTAAVVTALVDRRRTHALVVVALIATAAIPFAAFYRGHPFRIRYMIPLLAAEAIGAGLAAGTIRRVGPAGAVAVVALTAATLHPLNASAPMVVEAQWDRPNLTARTEVTACLGAPRAGEKIMASMGSLGHYMQEASEEGFALRDFLHEGNGDIWLAAIEHPRPFAAWILIEEKAEGGDMLARLARERPRFLDGYSRVCEGAGMALYRRK